MTITEDKNPYFMDKTFLTESIETELELVNISSGLIVDIFFIALCSISIKIECLTSVLEIRS